MDRPKAARGRNPILDKARQSQDWLQAGFGDFFEAAEQYNTEEGGVPLGEAFDAGITAALTRARAAQQLGPAQERKEAAHRERQEARTAEAQPAQRAEAKGTPIDPEAIKAEVAALDPKLRAAYREAIMDVEIDEAPDAYVGADYGEQDDDEDEDDDFVWNSSVELQQAEELAAQDDLANQDSYVLPEDGGNDE